MAAATDAKESGPPGEGEGAPPPRTRRPLLLIAAAGLVLVGGLGAGAFFLAPGLLGLAKPGAAVAKPKPKVHATVPLGSVVVNVAGEARRYVKVSVEVGLESAKAVHEVEAKKPQILDLLITVLASKEVDELAAPESRGALKEELLAGIHAEVGLEKVIQVFFTEFLIQ
jgi:flagellar FliL protein